jgi:hypothetical protein
MIFAQRKPDRFFWLVLGDDITQLKFSENNYDALLYKIQNISIIVALKKRTKMPVAYAED